MALHRNVWELLFGYKQENIRGVAGQEVILTGYHTNKWCKIIITTEVAMLGLGQLQAFNYK